MHSPLKLGLRVNQVQVMLQLVQIFLVGLTIGMTRVVVPVLAETEFGLQANSFILLTSFVVVFGLIKAVMNLSAGRLSELYGRKTVLVFGWLIAIPVPFLFYYSQSWSGVILATVLLGFNQGMAWSMALNSKLDLARPNQRGLINGLNEFSGYAAVGIAGLLSAQLVNQLGAREGLFYFGLTVIVLALLLALFAVKETKPWAALHPQFGQQEPSATLITALYQGSWANKSLLAINQAGMVEKFADALIWLFVPLFLVERGMSLMQAAALVAIYGFTWGLLQLVTGPLSDKIGRKGLISVGMAMTGLAIFLMPWGHAYTHWALHMFLAGLGMAMLYPNLGAAVGDVASVSSRAVFVGVYRFWRDLGYAIGALAMGVLVQWLMNLNVAFYAVGVAMIISAVGFHKGFKQD